MVFISNNLPWIVTVLSLLITLGTVLVTYGALKQKIQFAHESAVKFRQELYQENGVTNYVPRSEYEVERKEVMELVNNGLQEMKNDCATYRSECQSRVCNKVDELKKEVRQSNKTQTKHGLGLVAISTSLKLLLQSAKITPPDEINRIEKDLMEEPN